QSFSVGPEESKSFPIFLQSLSPSHSSISITRCLAFVESIGFQRARCPLAPQPRWLCYKRRVGLLKTNKAIRAKTGQDLAAFFGRQTLWQKISSDSSSSRGMVDR